MLKTPPLPVHTTGTTTSPTPSCTTATPGKYGHVDDPTACNAYWNYNPSFAAAIVLSVLFGVLGIAHVAQAFAYRKRYTWVLIMGILWEFASFVTRAIGTRDQQSWPLVIVSQILLLLAPLWINAFAYMTLGRLVNFFHPHRRIYGVKAASITKYFAWGDILSFLVQGTGGSMLNPGNSLSMVRTGLHVYMGGVGLQEFFIVIFTLLGIKFQRDMQHVEASGQWRADRAGWRPQIWNLYAVLGLITVRIIFRLIEYSRGTEPSNPIPYHEAYQYAFDALPMLLAALMLNIFHPGRVLIGPDSEFPRLTRKQKKALKREKKKEKKRTKEGIMRARTEHSKQCDGIGLREMESGQGRWLQEAK